MSVPQTRKQRLYSLLTRRGVPCSGPTQRHSTDPFTFRQVQSIVKAVEPEPAFDAHGAICMHERCHMDLRIVTYQAFCPFSRPAIPAIVDSLAT
jgi:hypothetical protein